MRVVASVCTASCVHVCLCVVCVREASGARTSSNEYHLPMKKAQCWAKRPAMKNATYRGRFGSQITSHVATSTSSNRIENGVM